MEVAPPAALFASLSPAVVVTTLPVPLSPLPTVTVTEPPRPTVATPVPIEIEPLLPELVVPLLKDSKPLGPALPALTLFTTMAPLDVVVPAPDADVMNPPVC